MRLLLLAALCLVAMPALSASVLVNETWTGSWSNASSFMSPGASRAFDLSLDGFDITTDTVDDYTLDFYLSDDGD